MTRIAFLFKDARRQRMESGQTYPSDLFYGFRELAAGGFDVSLIEQADLGVSLREGPGWKLANRLADALAGLHARAFWQLSRPRARAILDRHDALVVTQNSLGFCLAALKRLGRLRPELFFIVMGGLGEEVRGARRKGRSWGLESAHLLTLSRGEADILAERYGQAVDYLPFGIDTGFWTPGDAGEAAGQDDYVLAIGNDPHRDYPTLVTAWRSEFPRLKIVTRLATGPVPDNVEVIAGHYGDSALSDADIRDLYRGARFVVLPVRNTIQPSGQSVTLQAMACGRAVVLSRIDGIWDSEALRDGETCMLVPPGDPDALGRAVAEALRDAAATQRIAQAGLSMVRERFDIHRTADALARRIADRPLRPVGASA